jgi:two-component system NtrC family sensor kinase
MSIPSNRRILLIDDMPAIHDDFRKILAGAPAMSELNEVEAALFGVAAPVAADGFELRSAYQGREGLAEIERAKQAGLPYAMAFVDMRMPPGWNGVETIEQLWRADPLLQIVVCTAYSDFSWDVMLDRLDVRDRLLVLKKPFDAIEVRQLAHSLTAKWDMTWQAAAKMDGLEQAVLERTRAILHTNALLQSEMSERKQLESRLVQAEKLASIGQLAAGVAHEINNPIGFITSNFGTLETYVGQLFEMLGAHEGAEQKRDQPGLAAQSEDPGERMELAFLREDIPQLMRESKDGLVRVGKIIQALKDFARAGEQQHWERADLHQGIDSTLTIIASEIKYVADVVREYAVLPEIECLPSQLNQVFMNLLVNAAHASGAQRGRITVRSGVEGEHVWIEIADNGAGIPADVLPRIFDPFFTTKPIGKGTGLGLSLSYGIVQKHGGRIDVQTQVGQGSAFRVTLPVRHVEPERQADGGVAAHA